MGCGQSSSPLRQYGAVEAVEAHPSSLVNAAEDERDDVPGLLDDTADVGCSVSSRTSHPVGARRYEAISSPWDGFHMNVFSQALQELDVAYAGNASIAADPAEEGGRCMVAATNGVAHSGSYGEILPASMPSILRYVRARPGDQFYDLGSGTGKLVNLAALLGLRATGIELEQRRHHEACDARSKIATGKSEGSWSPPRLICGSFLEEDVLDLYDADVVVINSVMFGASMVAALGALAQARLKPGAKILTFQTFPGSTFEEIGMVDLLVSWKACGATASCYVQEVIGGATE